MPDDENPYGRSQILADFFQRHVPQVGGNFGTMTPQEEATSQTPGTALKAAADEALALPQKMFESSENLRQGGDFDPAPFVETAAMLGGGGLPLAEEGAAGIFGGKLARTANQAELRRAIAMDRKGMTSEEIFKETGWFRSPPDGQWRFEIPDDKMKTAYGHGTVGDLVRHNELFDAYPELANMKADITSGRRPEGGEFGGSFMPAFNRMFAWGPDLDKVNQITAHELQHKVQHIESFDPGTNMKAAGGRDPYKRSAGEVEARNTERRLDLSGPQRREMLPWETQDTPYWKQLRSPGSETSKLEGATPFTDKLPKHAEKIFDEGGATVHKLQKPGRWPTYVATRRGETLQFKDFDKAKNWATSPPVQRPDPVNPLERPPWE